MTKPRTSFFRRTQKTQCKHLYIHTTEHLHLTCKLMSIQQLIVTSAYCASLSTQHIRPSGVFDRRVLRPGIRCRTSSEIQHVVLTVLNSSSRQSSLVSTNVTSALEVFFNDMRYINPRFTYFTYLLSSSAV